MLARVRCSGALSAAMSLADQLLAVLSPLPEVQLAVVFGSRARGRATRQSDIDLAVAVEPDSPETRKSVWRTTLMAVPEADVVFTGDAPPLLRVEIARHGQPIIERRPHGWANFKAKAMIDWGDWAPFARRISRAAVKRLREEIDRGQRDVAGQIARAQPSADLLPIDHGMNVRRTPGPPAVLR